MSNNKTKSILVLVTTLLLGYSVQAQNSVNSSGGDATGSGGTLAYSLGQVVYTINADASGTVSQGVQQAYEIFTLKVKEPIRNISLSVFPNPTVNHLNLQISDYNQEKLSYFLFDLQGKLIKDGKIKAKQTQISTSGLPSATYILYIRNKNKQNLQSFKIIK
ncbi:T9SS type A sorting domain-containing protein, partial [Mesohalobacter halotolerans]